MPTDDDRPTRLRLADRDQRHAAILDDLTAHGPSTAKDLEIHLGSLINRKLLRTTLAELEASGHVVGEVRTFGRKEAQEIKPFKLGYKAKVYSVAGGK